MKIGKIQSLLVIGLLAISSSYVLAGSNFPSPSSTKCEFYIDLEKVLDCSKADCPYLTDYGYPYCKKFQFKLDVWKGALAHWIPKTTICLQSELVRDPSLLKPCKLMEDTAFGSHPTCYMKSGFCKLNYFDKQRVFNVVSWADIGSQLSQSVAQSLRVKATCDLSVFDVFLHFFDFYYEITRTMDAVTRLAAAEIFLYTPEDPKEARIYVAQKYVTLMTGNTSPTKAEIAANAALGNDKKFNSIENVYDICQSSMENVFCKNFYGSIQTSEKMEKSKFLKSFQKDVLAKRIMDIRRSLNNMK